MDDTGGAEVGRGSLDSGNKWKEQEATSLGSVGRSHVRLCGCWKLPVILGGAGWPKGSLLPTERTTVMLSDVLNPVQGSLLPY